MTDQNIESGAIGRRFLRFSHAWTFVIVSSLLTWLILWHGVPSVRHDWLFPVDGSQFVSRMLQLGTGWSSGGLGEPNPYPMTYFVTLPLALISLAIGPVGATALLVILAGASLAYAGSAIATRLNLAPIAGLACALFLAFNPWTYNKIVAGHLTQAIAYAGLAIVLSELAGDTRSSWRLLFGMVLAALQIQFFLIAVACCIARVREIAVLRAILAGVLAFLPTFVGIALDRETLLSWPLTIPWENAQSVPLRAGYLLNGYPPGYAQNAFNGVAAAGLWIALGMALAALFARPSKSTLAIAGAGAAALLFASGTTGLLGGVWRWSIVHVPVIGVFREMYDLIAVVAIAYALLATRTIARVRYGQWAFLGASLCLLTAWLTHAPWAWWVSAAAVPLPEQAIHNVARYAVLPAFQPVSFEGRGSGADPLFIPFAPANTPINSLFPTYPVDEALGRYSIDRDDAELRRLGVGMVICREGFAEDRAALYIYGRGVLRARPCSTGAVLLRDPAPIVAVASSVSICSVCPDAGSGNVFFGDLTPGLASLPDAQPTAAFQAIPALRAETDPTRAWIDARLAFAQRPIVSQPFGGAYTTSRAALQLPHAGFALALVRGSLWNDRHVRISSNTHGYSWLRLPPETSSVTCTGECAIAGVGDPGPYAGAPPGAAARALGATYIGPWIVRLRIPGDGAKILRFTEHYDASWIALPWPGVRRLPHVRIDGALNGWLLPAPSAPADIVLVELAALLQLVAGLIGFPIALVLLVRAREHA